jgi:purine-binding chemotaxis protein CheW
MDVRLRFGLKERPYDDKTCIVVVNLDQIEIGLIVDTVSEVMDIAKSQIDPTPQMHDKALKQYVMGIGKVDRNVIILLHLNNLVFGDKGDEKTRSVA